MATELARGPWDPNAQHGGAPAALLMRAFEACRPPRAADRPRHLRVAAPGAARRAGRSGRGGPAGTARAAAGGLDRTTERGRGGSRARAAGAARAAAYAGDAVGRVGARPPEERPRRTTDRAPTGRCSRRTRSRSASSPGAFHAAGPLHGLVSAAATGSSPARRRSPLQRLAAAGGLRQRDQLAPVAGTSTLFINPDLTLYVEREPVGEWVCLEARRSDLRRRASASARACCTTSAAASGGPPGAAGGAAVGAAAQGAWRRCRARRATSAETP